MKALVFSNFIEQFEKINEFLKCEQVDFEIIKFKNGEGKITIDESLENEDVIVFSDFSNSMSYSYMGKKRYYSKDEYCIELKRLLTAIGNAKSITLYLPLIYQSRQNAIKENESKDYHLFIQELKNLNVNEIISFELHGDDDFVNSCSLSELFSNFSYDVVVSPDAGGVSRAKKYAKILNCDSTEFSKVRDLNILVNGSNPIQDYKESCYDFENKKVLIVDDILDSGNTLINAINNIKKASIIDVFVAYPLFSNGIKKFAKLAKSGKLNKLYISDLIHVNKKYLRYKFVEVINTSEYVSKIISEV